MVFDNIDHFFDALFLGLSCTFVWACGERRIEQLYLERNAPWAGQRLICVGDYIQDLPERLQKPCHLEKIAQALGFEPVEWGYLSEDDEDDGCFDEVEVVPKYSNHPNAPSKSENESPPKNPTPTPGSLEHSSKPLGPTSDVDAATLEERFAADKIAKSLATNRLERREFGLEQRKKRVARLAQLCYTHSRIVSPLQLPEPKNIYFGSEERTYLDIPGVFDWMLRYSGDEDGRRTLPKGGWFPGSGSDLLHPPNDEHESLSDLSDSEDDEKEQKRKRDKKARILENKTFEPPYTEYPYNDRTRILRNLSRRQFVRSDSLAVIGTDRFCGLGRALLARICWSTDPSCAMSYDGDITRGVWAGDRFDIVRLSELGDTLEEVNNSGWKDVTKEVREEMIEIWKSEYGDAWMWNAW